MYERFVVDDDEAGSDIFSDCENIESDTEYTSEHCNGQSDDMLFAGAPISSSSSVVQLLSFVFKHKLTREAFSDLLALTEATAKKLFEFVSQAKKDIIKHFYCGYCNTYYGRVEDRTEVNKTCSICGRRIPEDSSFFVEVPIVKQLQKFFSSK